MTFITGQIQFIGIVNESGINDEVCSWHGSTLQQKVWLLIF